MDKRFQFHQSVRSMREDADKACGRPDRRSFLKAVGAGLALTWGMSWENRVNGAQGGQERPNILLVITDQQYADFMSCVGTPWLKTPAMDSIAKKGVRFTHAYVNYPVCMPQRYSLFTGRLPCTRKLSDPEHKPRISLGNQARQRGYETAYFGKWHIQDKTFTRSDTAFSGFDINEGGHDADMTDSAIKYLAGPKKKPFFAVVSYYNPHDICEWGRKKAGRTDRIEMRNGEVITDPPVDSCPPLPDNYAINSDEAEAVVQRRQGRKGGLPNAQCMAMKFTPDEWRQYRWAYCRLVELADRQIGRLLGALEKEKLTDNTIVIFTSDHGDGTGAHRWHQKSCLYEESCRVPLVVSAPMRPDARKNETDSRLVSVGIDMMATLSDIVGAPEPAGPYYGKSFWPFVLDAHSQAPTHEYVVTEAEVTANSKEVYQGRAVRTERYKYHCWSQGERSEQLFDMEKDPGETTNLAGNPAYADVLDRHRNYLDQWLKRTDDTYKGSTAAM